MTRWKQLKSIPELGTSSSSDTTLDSASATSNETPPSSHKSSVQAVGKDSPCLTTPFDMQSTDTACRLWNLDVDPSFKLSLPRRRRGSQSSPIEAPSANGWNDTDGNPGSIKKDKASKEETKASTNGDTGPCVAIGGEIIKDGSHFLVVDDNPINLKVSTVPLTSLITY